MNEIMGNSCFFGNSFNKKAVWEITDKCQQQCYHCCNHYRRVNTDIPLQKMIRIVEELSNNNVKEVLLTGGEPFLNKNIYLIIDELILKGISVSISTNGMLLKQNVKHLKKRKIKKIIVSLDTLNNELYRKLRGKNTNLDDVLNGIEKIKDNTNINITIHCVVNKLNINEVPNILNYANKKNLKFSISNLIPTNNKKSDSLVSTIDEITNMLKDNAILLKGIEHKCEACKNIIGIKANGYFTPCLWISNYTRQYDTYNLDKLSEKFNKEKYDRSCVAMYLNNKYEENIVKSVTIKLN